ncbi:MAG: hypothetical protein AAFY42_13195, partial [Pseudomonadota bacterium]
ALIMGAGPAPAAEPAPSFTPAQAFTSLEGTWEGTLAYRDYQSDNLETIPVAVDMEALPDGQTMVQRFDYSDPGFQVYITNLIAIEDGLLTGATARAGRAFETYEKRISVEEAASNTQWTAILSSEGSDDNRPAMIRETMVRDGDTVKITKEIDFLDDNTSEWEFRNVVSLAR